MEVVRFKSNDVSLKPSLGFSRSVLIMLATFLVMVAWSPMIPGLLGIKTALIYWPALLAIVIIGGFKIKKWILVTALIWICCLVSHSLITSNPSLLFQYSISPFLLWVSSILVSNKQVLSKIVTYSSIIVFCGLFFSFISVIYGYFGGSSFGSYENPDGRMVQIYFGSGSHSLASPGSLIRPNFIYDEPGAFSFVICSVCFLRTLLKKPKSVTLFLLLAGLITFSLAHLFVTVLYLFISKIGTRSVSSLVLFMMTSLTIALIISSGEFLNRLNVQEAHVYGDDRTMSVLAGDNRTVQVIKFLSFVDKDIILFGSYKCKERSKGVCDEHGDVYSSPISPVYEGGILFLGVQLLFHFLLIKNILISPNFLFSGLGMSALLLQRPFFLIIGYSVFILLLLLCADRVQNNGA